MILNIKLIPVGTIVAWDKSLSGTPTLPDDWLECDGSTVNDSSSNMNGQTLPDLNGENRFLIGSSTSGTTGGSSTHTHTINRARTATVSGSAGNVNTVTGSASNNPPYYNVVWIIKIK